MKGWGELVGAYDRILNVMGHPSRLLPEVVGVGPIVGGLLINVKFWTDIGEAMIGGVVM